MKSSRGVAAFTLLVTASCTTPLPPDAISADGSRIAYDLHGAPGPVLVLVHGWTNNRTFWDPHIPALSRQYHIATLDLAGFGESEASRTSWTMERFGEDVVAVIDAVGFDRVVLVGFSMGGAAVLEAASAMPDRVAGVVLVDVFHDVHEQYDQDSVDDFVRQWQESWHDRDYLRAEGFSPDAPDSLIQRYIEKTPADPPVHWAEIIRSLLVWRNTELIPTIQEVTAPVAAINGEYLTTDVEALRLLSPSFEMKTIPGVGHLGVIWMETELFDQHLRQLVEPMFAAAP